MKRKCTKCNRIKLKRLFIYKKTGKNGLNSWCRRCVSKNAKKWRLDNPEKYREQRRKGYWKNRETILEKSKIKSKLYYQRHKESLWFKKIEKVYKLSKKKYIKLIKSQRNKCKICRNREIEIDNRSKRTKRLAVDHCHKTGKVRGLLCSACNIALGRFRENVKTLKSAIKYLNKHK